VKKWCASAIGRRLSISMINAEANQSKKTGCGSYNGSHPVNIEKYIIVGVKE